MARIANGQVLESVLANKFDFIDENANATRMSRNLAGGTTESRSMFLSRLFGGFVSLFCLFVEICDSTVCGGNGGGGGVERL